MEKNPAILWIFFLQNTRSYWSYAIHIVQITSVALKILTVSMYNIPELFVDDN